MHLIATYLLDLMDCALSTSEKVPSPFLLISRYSEKYSKNVKRLVKLTVHVN